MNKKKTSLCILTLLCLHCTYSFTSAPVSSESVSHQAIVEAYFLPEAREKIFEHLANFLSSAQNKILIAMYWLTSDTPVLDLLGKAKERNVDIQIILDESTLTKFPDLIAKLATYNIVPLVSLRPERHSGRMHNKFIVIDDEKIWTGSANFTPTVLRPDKQTYNDENILIIKSSDIAKQYSNAFRRLEQSIIGFYMRHIDLTPIKSLPDWFLPLCIKLYETNNTFRGKIFEALTDQQNMQLQEKIYTIFPTLKIQQETVPASQEAAAAQQLPDTSQPTVTQADFFRNLRYTLPTSRHTATEFIDKLSRELEESEEYLEEPATDKQKEILKSMGENTQVSKREAIEIIHKGAIETRFPAEQYEQIAIDAEFPEEYEEYSSEPTMSELQEQEEVFASWDRDIEEETSKKRTREESQFQDEPATPEAQMRRLAPEEEATEKQKNFLEQMGYNPNVSRDEAEKIIKEIIGD